MAEEEQREIENALNTIASSMERATNMKKDLKQTVYDTVSTLRHLLSKLLEVSNSKTKKITELQVLVANTKAQLQEARSGPARAHATPSNAHSRERARTEGWIGPPSAAEDEKQHRTRTEQGKLYSQVLRGEYKQTHKITVTSKESSPANAVKEILRSIINPTEIKVGINTFKTLRNGKVLIEARSKDDLEILAKGIIDKCGDKLTVSVQKMRNPRLVIYDIPEDTTTLNIEDTIIAQNPELNLNKGDITAKFEYATRRNKRNLVIEVTASTRRQIIQNKKAKIGWVMCDLGDYLALLKGRRTIRSTTY